MSQKDRERLKNIASGDTAAAETAPSSRPAPFPSTITIPRTEPHIALAALRGGFVPFVTDATKQARYTAYLESQAGSDAPPPPPKPMPGQNIDEFNKELQDYAKAALIFKPLSGAMAGRFTSATIVEHGPTMNEGLYTPSAEDLAKKEAELQRMEEEKVTPKVHAARMGMYGPMTRETQAWQPAKLLCKRFKVKDPNPPPEIPIDVPAKAAYTEPASAGTSWDQFTVPSGDNAAGTSTTSGGRRDLSNIGLGEDEAQGRDTLTYQRPAMDVFKAIFASDDEDSDDDAKDDNDDEPPPAPQAVVPPPQAAPVPELNMPDSSETAIVDVATFKPTFIPREGKSKKDSDRAKDKKEKKEKKKKEKVLVSFQEDEEDGPLQISVKDRPKKKRRKDKQPDEEESMWVEKPAPEVVKEFPIAPSSEASAPEPQPSEPQAPKGRKRAIDFM
jgi:G patch domain-containing protein 1